MKLAGETLEVILSQEGKEVFEICSLALADDSRVLVTVEEAEDLGLWLKTARGGKTRYFLLRWEFILAIDLPAARGKLIGLKG